MPTAVTAENVESQIFAALKEMGSDEALLSREATFEQLDVDSLDLVELAQVIEDEFGVELQGNDVKDLRSVGDAIDLVVAKGS